MGAEVFSVRERMQRRMQMLDSLLKEKEKEWLIKLERKGRFEEDVIPVEVIEGIKV